MKVETSRGLMDESELTPFVEQEETEDCVITRSGYRYLGAVVQQSITVVVKKMPEIMPGIEL